jgi:recombinational DNA repair ATPase RecF
VDDALLDIVCERLDAQPPKSELAADLVLAACDSPDALSAALGGSPPDRPAPHDATIERPDEPAGAYLAGVTVEGFRGVGPASQLPLSPGPGLTVVVGRNGSGKSSFAEALEVLLTTTSDRLQKTSVFRDGWRNLHCDGAVRITAEVLLDKAAGTATIERTWKPDDDLDAGHLTVRVRGEPSAGQDRLGWDRALNLYRPFLSHGELEAMWTRPSDLHDRLAQVLGLEDLAAVSATITDRRKDLEAHAKTVKVAIEPLLEALDELTRDDERAARCAALLRARHPDIDELRSIATGTGAASTTTSGSGTTTATLESLARLVPPDPAETATVASALRTDAASMTSLAGTRAERAASLAALLRQALDHQRSHDGDTTCPVCRTPAVLDDDWASRTTAQIDELQQQADTFHQARDQAARTVRDATALVTPVPAVLTGTDDDLDQIPTGAARDQWTTWVGAPTADPSSPPSLFALADHLDTHIEDLHQAVTAVAHAARDVTEHRETLWAPLATQLAAWCDDAETAIREQPSLAALKHAESWLRATTDDIRNERLRPISDQAQHIWTTLRQQSNVALGTIRLSGTRTRRKVDFDVSVDGTSSDALGVMSQGEINALALSVFLPRASLPESPFRFVIIDDPVQAMDPSKVDGLARTLDEIAQRRQVIVFTHDDRLPESIRRLDINARLTEVTRQPGSVVTARPCGNPVERTLADARAVAKDPGIPGDVARRVVPGLCRTAVEITCTETTRGRLLTAGVPHAEVEQRLDAANTLTQHTALALFGDTGRSGEVLPHLNRDGRRTADTFQALNKGAHGNWTGDAHALIDATERLINVIGRGRR